MTTGLAIPKTEEEVDQALAWLTHLQRSRSSMSADRAMIESAVERLSAPGSLTVTLAHAAALLSPYYDKAIPQGIREVDAEYWADALRGFPLWAIKRACQWWRSDENPDRRRRPLEGDIVARVKIEMAPIRAMKIRMTANLTGPASPEPDRKPVTAEAAAEIMKAAGFRPKTFISEADQ